MKHLKRRLTAAILSVLLATSSFTAAPISVTAATTEETEAGECIGANDVADETPKSGITGDCTWELDEEGTLTISGNGCMENYNDTSFQSRWAHWRGSIKSIIIRKGVTGIGDYAFLFCDNLTNITIPDSVTTIGQSAFRCCYGLTSINIPDSVTTIGDCALYGCTGLTSVSIPDSVTTIGQSAFSGCTGLTSINLPDSVTSIGGGAFANTAWYNNQPDGMVYAGKVAYTYKGEMPADTTFDIRNGTKGIAYYAFYECACLTSVSIPDSVTTIGDSAFSYCTGLTSVSIPDSVTTIGGGAFSDCTGLTSINIPNSVTTIGNWAFSGCTGLTSINLPDSVTSIGGDAFANTAWYNNQPDGMVYAGKVAYTYKGEMPAGTTIDIRNGTKGIAYHAFYECACLKSVSIPDSVTTIGDRAFYGCTGLTSINIPDSVTAIGNLAFSGCTGLTSVIIPNKVTTIEYATFKGCTGLTSVIIPDSVTTIESYAFDDCKVLTSVKIPSSVKSIESSAFGFYYSYMTTQIEDFVIIGSKNSEAQRYANANRFAFVEIHSGEHSYGEPIWTWDEFSAANAKFTCVHSDDIQNIAATVTSKVSKEPTCTETGIRTYTAKVIFNGKIYTDIKEGTIPAIEHSYDSEVVFGNLYYDCNKIEEIDVLLKESWFEDNSYYNHDLARLCSEMVVAGYNAEKHLYDLYKPLEELGFTLDDVNMDTGRDEENYFIASRSIKKAGKDYNLVFCGCIGSHGKQWDSDFDPLGKERVALEYNDRPLNHRSFNYAKNFIRRTLQFYYLNHDFDKDNTILLLTGHSRGAAVANLLAAEIIDDDCFVTPDNLFTYTFATPNNTSDTNRNNPKYNSIYSIVFPNDFVTKVMPTAWGYGRYGLTYCLPTKTNDDNYSSYKINMIYYYKKLTGDSKEFSDYYEGEKPVRDVIDIMTLNVRTVDEFYNKTFLLRRHPALGPIVTKYITPFVFFKEGLCPFVNGSGDIVKPGSIMVSALPLLPSMYANISWFFIKNQKLSPMFECAHESQTYCAFMLALDSNEATTPRKGYNGSVNCPVDIEITEKESGEVVGRIVNNTVDEEIAAKPNSVVMTVDGDEKEFWLPGNGEYVVRLIGNDNGVMDYTVREIDPDTGETNRVNYYDVPVEKDKAYTDFFTSEKTFVITAENGSELTPDETFNSENEVTYSVTVTAEGSGTASDSLTVTSGDYVTLTASPVESEFLGWYQNDTLVSTDLEYRFRPTEDISLTAKFTGEDLEPVEFGDVDVDGEVTISDATQIQMYLAELVELEDVQVLLADYNLDGSVDISDATQIQLKLAELI